MLPHFFTCDRTESPRGAMGGKTNKNYMGYAYLRAEGIVLEESLY